MSLSGTARCAELQTSDALHYQSAISVAAGKPNDTILDFKHKTDSLAFEDSAFAGIGVTLGEFFANKGATKAHDADDRIIYDKTSGKLFYDEDGSEGPAKALLFATLNSTPLL